MGDDRDRGDADPHLVAGPLQHALDRPAGGGPARADREAGALLEHQDGGGRRQLSILILYSDTGGGHRAAALALSEALHRLEPGIRVARADPLIGQGPRVVRRIAGLYSPLIRRSRALWAVVYYGSNRGGSFAAIRAVLGPQVRRVLEGLIHQHDPDLVLSVHPLVNHVAWQAMARGHRRRGLMVVVTDLVEFHRGWAFSRADLVVVPSEGAFDECRGHRVPADRLKILGLPVSLRFRPAAPGEREALRRSFGLAEDRFTVLVVGGGEGSAGLIKQVRALCWEEHEWQVIAVCGRNERLRRRLGRVRFRTPTALLGFVDHMPELMRAADLVVTKAGPGAIGEALASDLPLLITSHLPGQETANIGYVTSTGVGLYVPDPEALQAAVARLAADGGQEARRMAMRAAQVWRPYAALDIAREAITIARRYAQAQTEASQANR